MADTTREDAVRRKHEAQGSDREAQAARECSEILLDERHDFVRKMQLKLIETKPAPRKPNVIKQNTNTHKITRG